MPASYERPQLLGTDQAILPGVDTRIGRFWFPSSEPSRFAWDIRGAYAILNRKVVITELQILLNRKAEAPTKGLETERIRRLTRLSPIRRAIAEQEETDRSRTIEGRDEARKSGRPSAVLETWAADYEERWAAPEHDAKPWSSRYPDDRWAEWAEDYLRRVRDEGTAYGVQGHITRERAWGNLGYETVRSRVKRMRNAGWIAGEGHLVKAGPRLIAWRSRKVRPQRGKRSG